MTGNGLLSAPSGVQTSSRRPEERRGAPATTTLAFSLTLQTLPGMKKHGLNLSLVILLLVGLACPPAAWAQQENATPRDGGPTNVIFFLVDDLGWMDLSVQGSEFYETPDIDRLASEGLRFTQAYATYPPGASRRAGRS